MFAETKQIDNMHYVTPAQKKWLLANGLKPSFPDKGITLTEAAQWFWDNHKLDCSYRICIDRIEGTYDDFYSNTYIWDGVKSSDFRTISDALTWAIDEAIKHAEGKNLLSL